MNFVNDLLNWHKILYPWKICNWLRSCETTAMRFPSLQVSEVFGFKDNLLVGMLASQIGVPWLWVLTAAPNCTFLLTSSWRQQWCLKSLTQLGPWHSPRTPGLNLSLLALWLGPVLDVVLFQLCQDCHSWPSFIPITSHQTLILAFLDHQSTQLTCFSSFSNAEYHF